MKMNKIDTYPDGSIVLQPAPPTREVSWRGRIKAAFHMLRTGTVPNHLQLNVSGNYFEMKDGESAIEVHSS